MMSQSRIPAGLLLGELSERNAGDGISRRIFGWGRLKREIPAAPAP
jgi:hypothetical protein